MPSILAEVIRDPSRPEPFIASRNANDLLIGSVCAVRKRAWLAHTIPHSNMVIHRFQWGFQGHQTLRA